MIWGMNEWIPVSNPILQINKESFVYFSISSFGNVTTKYIKWTMVSLEYEKMETFVFCGVVDLWTYIMDNVVMGNTNIEKPFI